MQLITLPLPSTVYLPTFDLLYLSEYLIVRNILGPNDSTIAKIPFAEVSLSQLVAYDSEKDLLPVMLANCTYTLEVGKDTSLQYNWEALQKQIVDKFIRGRPIVEFKVHATAHLREKARTVLSVS